MEKVKLTKEQAVAISKINNLDYAVDIHSAGKQPYPALRSLEASEFAKALYIGYEIEPEQPKFQQRDRVIHINPYNSEDWTQQFLIDVVITVGENQLVLEENGVFKANYLRHATPEETYWLETLNRDSVKDFRIGDVYIDDDCRMEVLEKDRHLQLANVWYGDGDFKGIYPAESFRKFPKEQSNAHHR